MRVEVYVSVPDDQRVTAWQAPAKKG